jgi:hypothetical protein
MSLNKKFYALFLASLLALTASMAQDRDFIPDEGEVVEGEFVINKELEISLPAAQRLFQKVPPDEIDKRESEPIQYTFQTIRNWSGYPRNFSCPQVHSWMIDG